MALLVLIAGAAADAASGPTLSQFRRLQREVNRLQNRVDSLDSRISSLEAAPPNTCLDTIPVAQFDDYEQYFDQGPISALDIDNANPDWQVVIRTC